MHIILRESVRFCLLLALCGAWLSRAQADDAYDEAVARGVAELEANHYPEAREEFRHAHALFPNARTLRGLGMVEFELRNYGECVRMLEEALASGVKPLDAKLRVSTESLLTRARRYLGEVHVQTEPSSASVIVDGTKMEIGAYGVLLLQVGEHAIEVRAPGRVPEKRVLRVRGGERTELRVELGQAGPSQRALSDRRDSAAQPEPVYKKWWLWTSVALVVVAGATTAAVLLPRHSRTKTSAMDGTGNAGATLQTWQRF
jgi:tetratricopeptide (TPR) repeat protein